MKKLHCPFLIHQVFNFEKNPGRIIILSMKERKVVVLFIDSIIPLLTCQVESLSGASYQDFFATGVNKNTNDYISFTLAFIVQT